MTDVETKIINREDYKLVIKRRLLNNNEQLLTISHWLQELGWQHQQLILSQDELKQFKDLL